MKRYVDRNNELIEGLSVLFPEKADEIRSIKEQYSIYFDKDSIVDEYMDFKKDNESTISDLYSRENNYQTNTRGVKVRGTYDSLQEAQTKAEALKRKDNNKFNIYVGQVGCWCPWSANPNEIDSAEYSETQLNTLMKEYHKNKDNKEIFYNERKKDLIDRATDKSSVTDTKNIDESSTTHLPNDVQGIMEQSDTWIKTFEKEGSEQ
jgi:hypothetical protein